LSQICILTAAPDYFEDLGPARATYQRLLGEDIAFRHWTDPGDLTGFDLVLPLLVWGYQRDCPRWFALLEQLEQQQINLANPVSVLRWNSNKSYLLALEKAGVAVVPTLISAALTANDIAEAAQKFGTDQLVVKPPISGGADGTYRLQNGEPLPEDITGKEMLIQPFQPAIAEEGEYSLFYFGGTFSHAILKRPARGDFRVQEFLGGSESGTDCPEGAQDLAVQARQAAEQILDTETLLYTRADMLRDAEGHFRLMELELIEPSLFFGHAADGGVLFATGVNAALPR
jgi:glutathione synthase/RimK-type ligase-like ATP-grasp enzyme